MRMNYLWESSHITKGYLRINTVTLLTFSAGPGVSNKHRSTQWDHSGDDPEQPVCHMSGWNKTLLHTRELHKRKGCIKLHFYDCITVHGLFLKENSCVSDCMTFQFWSQMTQESLIGDPTIRWGDKSYNSVVFSDGTFGSTCDVSLYVCVMLLCLCFWCCLS